MKTYLILIFALMMGASVVVSCGHFLDAKPVNTLAQPSSLKDLRALLDFEEELSPVYSATLQLATDEFVTTEKGLASINPIFQDMYLWKDNLDDVASWRIPYKVISVANVVLEALDRISDGKSDQGKLLKGEALFLRGWMFFTLAQLFCKHYNINDNGDDLGLVLRLDADSKINLKRSSLKQTFEQLLGDLVQAEELLGQSPYVTRPSKVVAQGALARVYLSMGNFEMAEKMADAVLLTHNKLLDYNLLKPSDAFPINFQNNKELLFYGISSSNGYFIYSPETHVNPELIKLYAGDDLRNEIFFETSGTLKRFKGFYNGRIGDVTAVIAIDEIYLIKAECAARRNDLEQGLFYLNHLRKHRFAPNSSFAVSAVDAGELLRSVLKERKMELLGRGLRWYDLRRLNIYPEFAETMKRNIEQSGEFVEYILEPNDLRYVRLIPRLAIEFGGYIQNPR